MKYLEEAAVILGNKNMHNTEIFGLPRSQYTEKILRVLIILDMNL